jgi:hypothetical protein
MDDRDHWLAAGFDVVADVGQERRHRRLAELADVGAADEGLSAADN